MKLAPDHRAKQIGLIHIGANALGMDTKDDNPDSEYRAMLWAIGRVRSAAHLDFAGRKSVIDHLKALGAFRGGRTSGLGHRTSGNEWSWVDRAAPDRRPMLKKIIMVCKSAGWTKRYVDGTCRRMFRIDRVEMMAPDQLHDLIAALVKQQGRDAAKREHSQPSTPNSERL